MSDDQAMNTIPKNEPSKKRQSRRPSAATKEEFKAAKAAAHAAGFNVDFLDPVREEPQLTERLAALAPAITNSVNQGNQHGAAFLNKLMKKNPGHDLTSDEQTLITARHNWEASQKPKRPKLNRNKTPTKVAESVPSAPGAPPASGPVERPKPSEEQPAKPDGTVPSDDPAPRTQSAEDKIVFIPWDSNELADDTPAEPVRKLPQAPQKIPFLWNTPGENLANAFFESIFKEKAFYEIRNAAMALKVDSAALASVRSRGAAVSEYLDEAFRDLGII